MRFIKKMVHYSKVRVALYSGPGTSRSCLSALTYQLTAWGACVVKCRSPQQLLDVLHSVQNIVFPGGADLPYLRRFRTGDYKKFNSLFTGGVSSLVFVLVLTLRVGLLFLLRQMACGLRAFGLCVYLKERVLGRILCCPTIKRNVLLAAMYG
jgi:hypothetical protein